MPTLEEDIENLAEQLGRNEDLGPLYAWLDETLKSLEANEINVDDILPVDVESGLGFSLRANKDGKALWESIVEVGRERLCGEDKRRNRGQQVTAGALATELSSSFGLPEHASGIVVAVSAFILIFGRDVFCNWSSPE